MGLKKQKAHEFIEKNIDSLSSEEIVNSLATDYGYSKSYSQYLLRSFDKRTNKSLREVLEDIERREQRAYIEKQERLRLDRPKIFIDL